MAPPSLPERLLAWVLGPGPWTESILGDLHEEHAQIARVNRRRAAFWYCRQALRLGVRAAVRPMRRERRAPQLPSPRGDSPMRTLVFDARYAVRSMIKGRRRQPSSC